MKNSHSVKVALVTGSAKRIGAALVRHLHSQNFNVVVHYRTSSDDADVLCQSLNAMREGSAIALKADLLKTRDLSTLVNRAEQMWNRLDVLVNNASSFFPTPVGEVTEVHWDNLLGSNLKAPYFLSQTAAPFLAKQNGCIINLSDIHASKPLSEHSVYCIAKAGLNMLTKTLAKELGPHVRVNAIAPGAILWPTDDNTLNHATKEKIIHQSALKKSGSPNDIADTISFLINSHYITGQIVTVDGGRI